MAKLKYNKDFPLKAEDYARQGMIDEEIWKKLGVGKTAYYRYVFEYKDFRDALKRGKAPVDVEVENKLLKRAQGYEYEEVMVEYKPGIKVLAGKKPEEIDEKAKPTLIRKTKKMVIPDVVAIIFWLKNRRPDLWRDRQETVISGKITYEISEKFMPKVENEDKL